MLRKLTLSVAKKSARERQRKGGRSTKLSERRCRLVLFKEPNFTCHVGPWLLNKSNSKDFLELVNICLHRNNVNDDVKVPR